MATSPGSALLPEPAPIGHDEPTRRFLRSDPELRTESEPPEGPLRPSHVAPTLAARAEAHAQAALSASVRAEARLGSLFRTIQHFSAAVSSAREANDLVSQELDQLRELLESSNEQQMELRHRVTVLEQALARTEQQAAREREFLIDQQDAFILLLCQEQERDVQELLRLRLERDQLAGDLGRVQSQRDEAQAAVVRIASERDQALIELSRTRSSERPRVNPGPKSEPAGQPVAKLELEALTRSETQSAPPSAQSAPPSAQSAPPSAQPATSPSPVSSDSSQSGAIPTSKTPLKSKPDPSTRPLIGYSLAGDEVAEETIEGTKISARPPER
jgi:hypothetical protein